MDSIRHGIRNREITTISSRGYRCTTRIGIENINEGEFTKGGDWLGYIEGRLGGFETADAPSRCFPHSINTLLKEDRCF